MRKFLTGCIFDPVDGEVAPAVTVAQLVWVTACLSLEDRVAFGWFCTGLERLAVAGKASGCDVIMSAGCIPTLVQCLRRWPAENEVVFLACGSLLQLARHGSAAVVAAIKCIPGIVDTLRAVDASGLANDRAADTLEALGIHAAEVGSFAVAAVSLLVLATSILIHWF